MINLYLYIRNGGITHLFELVQARARIYTPPGNPISDARITEAGPVRPFRVQRFGLRI
jgi:hypothetical protein